MPELIHTFTKGKMNKDLDERLVPNGEYRDALNLEVSTSSSGNVGALQNIKGNTPKPYRYLNQSTGIYTPWTSGYIDSLSNPKKIGEIFNAVTEKIYWFIASDGVSAIAEYNQIKDTVVPILVDAQGILNFSEDYLITGINIVDDLLFWTDDQTEPKVVNIKDFAAANEENNFNTHTTFNGRDFIEDDITVIKKAPTESLGLELANTRIVDQDGETAVVEALTNAIFVIEDPEDPTAFIPIPIGSSVRLDWIGTSPFYRVGDILILKTTFEDADDEGQGTVENEVRVEVESVPVGTQAYADVTILSVPETIVDSEAQWNVSITEKPLFEFKFPRFAYRYKYKDNYYSTFSPFTEIAFLPGKFDYAPKQGYNLGMVNQLKQCVVYGFIPSNIPPDVVEVDLLYKESNSPAVYVVETFKKEDETWEANEYNIESEVISALLPSNQILRNFDNVPRKAKAQEVTGNRLIYANYLQNFNLKNNIGLAISPTVSHTISHNALWDCNYAEGECIHSYENNGQPEPKIGFKSIKTQRTYQVGVIFQDKFGRKTPVFTSESASSFLLKTEAVNYNQITAQATGGENNKPVGFTNFKYYVKEASAPYYNLAMDRWYDAEDGNVWISFPSSERNKVDEDTFLELKKAHDSDVVVTSPAKYKVIDIKNEAPLFLKTERNITGSVTDISGNTFPAPGLPEENGTYFDILQADIDGGPLESLYSESSRDRFIRFTNGVSASKWYAVQSIAKLQSGDTADRTQVTIKKPFGSDINWVINESGNGTITGIKCVFATEDVEDKPEFEGRFFVKLYRDSVLQENVLQGSNEENYQVNQSVKIGYLGDYVRGIGNLLVPGCPKSFITGEWGYKGLGIDEGDAFRAPPSPVSEPGSQYINFAFTGIWPEGASFNVSSKYPQFRTAIQTLETVGGLFRFKEDPGGVVYKILETTTHRTRNYQGTSSRFSYNDGSNKRAQYRLKVEPVSSANGTGLWQGPPATGETESWRFRDKDATRISYGPNDIDAPTIEFVSLVEEDPSFSTDNPAIFETEPKEGTELELFYETANTYSMEEYGQKHILGWSNCFSFGNGVESDRIRDDFNALTIDNGPIVSTTLNEPYAEERRATGLIFSQIYNSTSGINNLNQFIQAEAITKDLNPVYSSIQKLHTRDTNLVTLCEDKCLSILAFKDALFNADGNSNVTSNNSVLGQAKPFAGEFGISKNPESFATYGFRMYFTDKNRGVVLRLSNNGLEDISRYGMSDFFSDNLKESTIAWGSFDDDKGGYNLNLNNISTEWNNRFNDQYKAGDEWKLATATNTTITFNEGVNGWQSRKTFSDEGGISLNDRYYTFKNGSMYEHRTKDSVINNFYGVQYDSSMDFLINESPTSVKKFKTLNYTGSNSREYVYGNENYSNLSIAQVEELRLQDLSTETLSKKGWYTSFINTDLQKGYIKEFINKENKFFQYIKGESDYFKSNLDNNINTKDFQIQGIGRASSIIAPPVSEFNVRVYVDLDCSNSPPASFLRNSWGARFSINAGIRSDNNSEQDIVGGATELANELPSLGHVITNFTQDAHGYYYTLRTNPYVDVAEQIHPAMVPSLEQEQKTIDVINVFKNAGKKVILYINGGGPSFLQGDSNEEIAIGQAWADYCNANFGGDQGAGWRNLARGYFERFRDLGVDGYWIDNMSNMPGEISDFMEMIREVDPYAIVATNITKSYVSRPDNANKKLKVDSDGVNDNDDREYNIFTLEANDPYMDFTAGHPTPLGQGAPPNSWAYEENTLALVTENPWDSYDGSKKVLKHGFFPIRAEWTDANEELVFGVEQAYRFVRVFSDAGAAITWSTTTSQGYTSTDELTILKEIDRRISQPIKEPAEPYVRPEGAAYVTIQ